MKDGSNVEKGEANDRGLSFRGMIRDTVKQGMKKASVLDEVKEEEIEVQAQETQTQLSQLEIVGDMELEILQEKPELLDQEN